MGDKPQFIKPIGVYERDTRCLAPVNVRSLFPPIEEDFGLYISSGTAGLDGDSPRDFWAVARTAREQVARAVDLAPLGRRAAAISSLMARIQDPRAIYEPIAGE